MTIKWFKRYYLMVAALIVTFLFIGYYFHVYSTNYDSDVSKFQEKFAHREERLNTILDYKVNEVDGEAIHDQWFTLSGQDDINIHIYRRDSLIYWNTNQLPIIRFAEIHFPADGILNLQNGWYYAKTKQVGDYLICASFLIKHDYAYENNHLINTFSEYLPFPFEAEVISDEDRGFPVYTSNGEYACSLIIGKQQPPDHSESITLMVLLIGAIILWLYWLMIFRLRSKSRWTILIPFAVLLTRVASIHFGWFHFLADSEAFDPALYGTSHWFPHFFGFLVNIVVIIYLMNEMRLFLDHLKKEGTGMKILAVGFGIGSVLLWGLLIYLTRGLIENSTIPLLIDQLLTLNAFSVLAIAGLGVYFYVYFQMVKSILDFTRRQSFQGSQLAVLYFGISCAFLLFEINFGNQLLLAGLFPVAFYGMGLYMAYLTKGTHQLGTGLILLFAFAMVMSATMDEFGQRKERGVKELYANQLATEKDVVTEMEYSGLVPELKKDKFLRKLISTPTIISRSDFQENLERRFFNGFWEQYEMSFALFNDEHLPIVDRTENSTKEYDHLQEIIDSSGVVSEIDSGIYFISDYREHYHYIIRQEMAGNDSTSAILFCTLKSKKIPEEIGFPRLLISGNANVFESLEKYSIAKYHGTRLVNKYGEFNYPSSYLKMMGDRSIQRGFFDFGDYNHFILKKSTDDAIVLSSKNPTVFDVLTSFSYLFSFYGLLLLPLMFRANSTGVKRYTLNLAMKIQLVLISLVFISLLAFGWGSGIFVSNQYNQYTNDVIREKMSSVETEVRSKLGQFKYLSIEENGDRMQYYLQKFSRVFFTDINLYDTDGYLLATSRPKVFNVGLISEQMNPEAFKNMKYEQKSEFVHHESIGKLNYSSAYQPFYNDEGKKLAFLNLQHFGQQSEFENQIQKFLVAIINVFILLLAISIILAIFISNWLTAPLRILQESFAAVRFGTHNEPISYRKEDEIGALVKEYNQKLEELEFAAQQLARSERESAWREMAKQVAHEIKNPLTPMKLSVQQLQRSYNPEDPKSEAKLQKVASSIIEQIDALTKIANEFASFAKMPLPSEEHLNLVALIKGVKEVFEVEGEHTITVTSNKDDIRVKADKNQLIRVFNNLIKNAMQAIPKDRQGKIDITIEQQGEVVRVTVSDNGVGIEASRLSKIFVPYFTTKSTGTGLGLAMVKQIIENHKGTIDFETEEGKGTTFFVELPAIK